MRLEPILSQARSFPEGRTQLVVSLRRSFSFATGTLTEVPPGPVKSAFECAVNRTATDVIVEGHACLGRAQSAVAEVVVGEASRRVRAYGPRLVQHVSSSGVSWSAPTQAGRVRLSASEAYGGSWEDPMAGPLDATAQCYPRNPEGRGFVTAARAHALLGGLMPSLEDPESPVASETIVRESAEDWLDAPFPPLFGWMDPSVFPRYRFFGGRPSHKPFRVMPRECVLGVLGPEEVTAPRLARQVDIPAGPGVTIVLEPRAFSAGAAGLSNHRLIGREPVVLRGFFHDMAETSFVVPPYRSIVGLTPPGCPRFDLPATLSALMIDADARTATTVEQATLDVAAQYPDAELRAVRVEVLGIA